MQSELVMEIITKSIFTVEAILRVDSEDGTNVRSLDQERLYKQSVKTAAKAFITNQDCYRGLIRLF